LASGYLSSDKADMRILAVRVGRVGDTVMMTPALTAILECYPDAEVTILASPEGKLLLKDFHPRVKDVWTWNRNGLKSGADEKKLRTLLNQTRFDLIFCFDTSPRIARLFENYGGQLHWFRGGTEIKHCARNYLDLVATACGCEVRDIYNNLPVKAQAREAVDAELEAHGIRKSDLAIMIHPTYSGYSRFGLRKRQARKRKLWPPQKYGELGKRLATLKLADGSSPKAYIVLLPAELPFGKKIVQHSDNSILLLESHPTFDRYKAMIQRADVLLTPDSGPMHIASALGTNIIAFFSMKDPTDCGPWMDPDSYTILRSEDTATPEQGIAAISVDTVFDACSSMLDKALRDRNAA
jgi:ADP-heptose:LPS heptosyltransferase